jgi:hypothetical protein
VMLDAVAAHLTMRLVGDSDIFKPDFMIILTRV